jgi:hypothetical protein
MSYLRHIARCFQNSLHLLHPIASIAGSYFKTQVGDKYAFKYEMSFDGVGEKILLQKHSLIKTVNDTL